MAVADDVYQGTKHNGTSVSPLYLLYLYKVTDISSLYEFAEMFESSSTAGVNRVQLVRTQDGKVIVPVYDWSAFLGQYLSSFPA